MTEAARDDFLASVQRDVNSITDADRSTRRRAFQTLRKRCDGAPGRANDPGPADRS